MKVLWMAMLLCAVLAPGSVRAQMSPSPPAAPDTQAPAVPVLPPASLDIAPNERREFELGTAVARGIFAYTPLATQSSWIERSHAIRAKVGALGKLAPEALRARDMAAGAFTRASQLMQDLDAPTPILSPITRLAARLARPLPETPDARAIASLNADAATVLSALSESNVITKVMNDKALVSWLNGSVGHRSGPVWYAEGLMAGVAELAASRHLPELLPSAADLSTDLRGLRDWLALRVPDNPVPDLATLQSDIAAFLQQTAQGPGKPRLPRAQRVTNDQLQMLGDISRLLQAQMLLATPSTTANAAP